MGALFLSACSSDFLERNPLDQPSNEGFWNTEKDAVAAAMGCYDGWFSMTEVISLDCASDNAHDPFPWEGWSVQASGYATPSDPGTDYFGYNKMVRYNNFLENIHRPEMDDALRARLTAEVRFLRAWDYFWKVLFYGDVPLVKEVLPITDANKPRNPKEEVIQFILDELTEITPQLEIKYTGNDVGRVTRGAALTLKARMLLYNNQYADCLKACEEIMKLGYSLFPNYRGLFRISNKNNQEIIMDVQYVENLYSNGTLGILPPASCGGGALSIRHKVWWIYMNV